MENPKDCSWTNISGCILDHHHFLGFSRHDLSGWNFVTRTESKHNYRFLYNQFSRFLPLIMPLIFLKICINVAIFWEKNTGKTRHGGSGYGLVITNSLSMIFWYHERRTPLRRTYVMDEKKVRKWWKKIIRTRNYQELFIWLDSTSNNIGVERVVVNLGIFSVSSRAYSEMRASGLSSFLCCWGGSLIVYDWNC